MSNERSLSAIAEAATEISEEQWAALASVPDAGVLHIGRERRTQPRADHRVVAQVFLGLGNKGAKERYLIRTRDLSQNGIGFLHSKPVQIGVRCEVALLTSDNRLLHRSGAVAACTPQGQTLFAVGIKLDKPLPASEVEAALAGSAT